MWVQGCHIEMCTTQLALPATPWQSIFLHGCNILHFATAQKSLRMKTNEIISWQTHLKIAKSCAQRSKAWAKNSIFHAEDFKIKYYDPAIYGCNKTCFLLNLIQRYLLAFFVFTSMKYSVQICYSFVLELVSVVVVSLMPKPTILKGM